MEKFKECMEKALVTGRKKWNYQTFIEKRGEDKVAVKLHDTDICVIDKHIVSLYSGGWMTPLTKNRINSTLEALELKYYISQSKNIWYLNHNGLSWRYQDGITINRWDGEVTKYFPESVSTAKKDIKLKADIKAYAQMYADKIPLDKPSNGDCWYCLFTSENKTMGDITKSNHILEHIKEGYIVPSLAFNALKEYHNAPMAFYAVFEQTEFSDSYRKELKKAVYKYCLRRLGFAV